MKRFKNIIYVSEAMEDQALDRAVSLAESNEATLTIIDVVAPVSDDYRSETITSRANALQSLIEPYRNRLKIQLDVSMGTTFLEVIRAVLRNGHDLVIKTAENPGFIRRLFGSDDMHLLRKCPCPVWIMKPLEKSGYNCIMAAVDFNPMEPSAVNDELNGEILDLAGSIALSDSGSLHLVHAWEAFAEKTIQSRSGTIDEVVATYIENQRELHKKGLYMLNGALRARIGTDLYNRLSPGLHLHKGPAKVMIAKLAVDLNADLVVMGTIARTGISGLIIGNTAEAILDQLSCSVLAVKPPGFITPVKLEH